MVDFAAMGMYFLDMFLTWVKTLFVVPVQNVDMLWLLVPIWATWVFAEFFQEKNGTSMGNAITNSVVVIWGSIDCTRQTFRLIHSGALHWGWNVYLRFLLILLILIYGLIIVILGLKGNVVIRYIGRVREVTYVFAMFVPVFYNAIPLTLKHVITAIVFLPIFYFVIELIDRYTPNPKAVVEDMERSGGALHEEKSGELGGLDEGFGKENNSLGSESMFEEAGKSGSGKQGKPSQESGFADLEGDDFKL